MIFNNVHDYTIKSSEDYRFKNNPITLKEIKELTHSITLLNDKKLINDIKEWKLGKDGIILECEKDNASRSAIYLPSVPTEQGWKEIDTMESLSRKAGVNENDWDNKKICKIFIIPGYEF